MATDEIEAAWTRLDQYADEWTTEYAADLARVRAERDTLRARVAALEAGAEDVLNLIGSSRGVMGLRLNGDMVPWDDLRTGGMHEVWLVDFDASLRSGPR